MISFYLTTAFFPATNLHLSHVSLKYVVKYKCTDDLHKKIELLNNLSKEGQLFWYWLNIFKISEEIANCRAIPSNPAACYMGLSRGQFSTDMCQSLQGYPPRLTSAGEGQELLNIFASEFGQGDSAKIWVGLTTTSDQ